MIFQGGGSATWFVILDNIRQANLPSAQQDALMLELPSLVADAVNQVKSRAETVLGITTTTDVTSSTTESTVVSSTTINLTTETTTSRSDKLQVSISIGLSILILYIYLQ